MNAVFPPTTVLSFFAARVAAEPARPALFIKQAGTYCARTWAELDADVRRAAAALVGWGLQPGERVVQQSENRYEWVVADLAIQLAGGVHVPGHASLTGEQLAAQIGHSGARLVLVSKAEQAAKLARCAAQLPADLRGFAYEPGAFQIGAHPLESWPDLVQRTSLTRGLERQLESRREGVTPETLATILYTSGTLGEPKGVMLTHGNLAFNAWAGVQATGESPADCKLCLLPLSHIFGRTSDLYKWIVSGSQLALAESRETVLADCLATQPTWLNGVPYFYDKVRRALRQQHLEQQPGSLRTLLGGRIQTCHVGGAPVSDELYEFYWSRGVPLFTGYGLTEASPVVSISTPQQARCGAVGRALVGTELQLAPDGEVLTRGPHVMLGYWNDAVATATTLRDGWLYTGDLGRLDDSGFLYLTGRKKELLVTTGGKKVAPAYLEALLAEEPWIEQALVVGEGRDYLAALIVPHRPAWPDELAGRGLTDPMVLAQYRERIRQRLAQVSHYEQIGRFLLLEHPFSIERGELTPKQSLRRAVIEQRYAAEIARLYQP